MSADARRPPWALTVAITVLSCCWLAGCARQPTSTISASTSTSTEGSPSSAERAGAFQQQAVTTSARDEAWNSWFAHITQTDGRARCYPQRCFQSHTQHMLWDEALAQRLIDRSSFEGKEPSQAVGPLAVIRDFERQLRSLGIDFLVIFVPPAAAVYPEMAGAPTPLADGETPPLLDFRLRGFYATLEQEGIEVIDLLPTFLEHRYSGDFVDGPGDSRHQELLFQRQDPHWTSLGSGLAAKVIVERIRRYPWFEEAAAPMGRARLVEETKTWDRYGAAMVRLIKNQTRDRLATPKERLLRRTVRIDGERWSLNDKTSPIVLLGDSFSVPDYSLVDQILLHLGFRVDRISVTGGAPRATLKALQLRDNALAGKQLVIWEITSYALIRPQVWRPVNVLAEPPSP